MSIKSLANLRLSSVSTFDNNRQEISTMARGDKNKIVHVIKLAGRELSLKTWEHKCIKTFSDSASAGAGKANLKLIAAKKSAQLSEKALQNCLQFIADRIVAFIKDNEGLKKISNKEEVVAASVSLKNKIEELFKELEEADGSGSGTDGESDDDELSMLIEHENRGTDDPAVCEEPEVGNPAKVPRIESGSLSPIKRSVGPRTSSPAPSITTSIPDSHNSTQDYGMTSDDVADDMGFLFVPATLPNINDQNSGKIINKVKWPLMTSMYRQKEGRPYTPSYMMGYAPADVKAEKELDDNGGARRLGRQAGHCFIAGTVNTDPLKREHAPLKTAYRWSCEQHCDMVATNIVMRAHSQRVFTINEKTEDNLEAIVDNVGSWVREEWCGVDGAISRVIKQMVFERKLDAEIKARLPLEKMKQTTAKINEIEAGGVKRGRNV